MVEDKSQAQDATLVSNGSSDPEGSFTTDKDDKENVESSAYGDSHDAVPSDPLVVDWEGPDDPKNPINWDSKAKGINIFTILFMCFLTPLASSMFAPGVPDVLADFHSDSQTLAEFVVSVYILGFAFGPLLISPMSEMYGRRPVYIVCNVLFIVFTVACAVSQSLSQLIVFRFFAGSFGVCPVTLGGASIADLIIQERRGAAMSLFGMGPLMGPVVGPIAGGFLANATSWRWVFWVITIAYGVTTIVHFLLCKETYAPVLLHQKTQQLIKAGGNPDLKSKLDDGLSFKERMSRALIRPCKMLIFSPIVLLTSLYVAIAYGILYLLFTTFTFVFEREYHFSSSIVGLTFIAVGIGMLVGLIFIGATSDRNLKRLAAKHGGELKPEYRLPPLMMTCLLVPVGLIIYGWCVEYYVQWAVPLFGTLLFGIGAIAIMVCIQQYLIDAFTRYAASAVAANTLLRSIVAAVLPLAGLKMYEALGFGWGNTLLAFIGLALAPIPYAFYRYGEKFRKKWAIAL